MAADTPSTSASRGNRSAHSLDRQARPRTQSDASCPAGRPARGELSTIHAVCQSRPTARPSIHPLIRPAAIERTLGLTLTSGRVVSWLLPVLGVHPGSTRWKTGAERLK
jgi:hypothetical protein